MFCLQATHDQCCRLWDQCQPFSGVRHYLDKYALQNSLIMWKAQPSTYSNHWLIINTAKGCPKYLVFVLFLKYLRKIWKIPFFVLESIVRHFLQLFYISKWKRYKFFDKTFPSNKSDKHVGTQQQQKFNDRSFNASLVKRGKQDQITFSGQNCQDHYWASTLMKLSICERRRTDAAFNFNHKLGFLCTSALILLDKLHSLESSWNDKF